MNQRTHRAPASSSHLVPKRAEGSEPNFLDLALEESESEDDSEGEWEEVPCTTNNTVVDRPLIAAPSGFILPTCGKRSEVLTLEIIEDWQPSSLPSASHADDPQPALSEDTDSRLVQEPASEEDDTFEAGLRLEAELAKGMAELTAPVPGPSQKPGSRTPNAVNSSPFTRPPVHLNLEVIGQPSPAQTSVEGKEKAVDRKPVERPRKTVKRPDPPRVSLVTEGPPTHKPKVSFREKVIELARSKGKHCVSSKPLAPRDPIAHNPSSTTGGPSSAPKHPPHPRIQAASGSSGPLFTSKGFSHHVRNLRERQTEDARRRFYERYEGPIVGNTRQDIASSKPTSTSMMPLDAPKGAQPTQKRQVQRTAGGKRISKAQAQADEVMKICRSTKSYIVDVAAIKRRGIPTLPEAQHSPPPTILPSVRKSSIQSEKTAPVIASQRVSKTQPQVRLLAPRFPPHPLPTSSGATPRGLKFTKKQNPALEHGEVATKTVEAVTSPDRDTHGPRLASVSRDNGPLMTDVPKRRLENSGRELEGPSPRKKPRLGRS